MEDNKITERESLLIIQKMIQAAKKEQKDNGVGWIAWGWLLFLVSVLSYLNIQNSWFEDQYMFWNFFGLITLLALLYNIVRYFFFPAKKKAHTYTTDIFQKLNIGFFFLVMLIVLSMNKGVNPTKAFVILIGLYGFWILIYGTLMNFRPSVVTSFVTWAIAFAALYTANNIADVMLFHAGAVLCGYIIPGHIAYYEFRKINTPVMA
ncbi:MAG: hypothetical protein QM731_17295 [Chitinophagaceae bacterium]